MTNKSVWICILFILAGLVIGGLIGNIAKNVSSLEWLNYGKEFGISSPFVLDLSFLKLTFGLMFYMNISSIIGLVIALVVYKLIMK